MAHHVAVRGLEEEGTHPESLRQRAESQGSEEALAVLDHLFPVGVLLLQEGREVVSRIGAWGRHQGVDIAPILGPEVAQKVRRNGAGGRDEVAVFFVQAGAHIRVQGEVEGADLIPEAVEFLGEIVGRHIVFRAPHGAVVLETEFFGALVGQFDVAGEVLAHGPRDGVPAGPGIEQLPGVAAIGHDFGQGLDVLAAIGALGAVFSFPVRALETGGDAGQFFAFLGILGSGDGE